MTYWLGAPLDPKDVEEFKTTILDRYAYKEADAVTYLDRIIDRQLNKARGILTFDALIIAVVSRTTGISQFGFILLAFSALICLFLFWVYWGPIAAYQTFEAEIKSSIDLIRIRSFALAAAIGLSALGFIFVVV